MSKVIRTHNPSSYNQLTQSKMGFLLMLFLMIH